jgi:hypothetical protein
MNGKTIHGTTVLVVTVCLILGLSGVVPGAAATIQQDEEPPDTPEEFLATFQALEGTESFEAHSELEVIRSQAVQDVQVGEFTDAKEQRLSYVLELLWTFDDAVRMQENESYDRALALGNESRDIAAQLRETEQGEQYALLADIALDRFYEQTAQTLLSEAEETENTPTRIKLLSQTALAYNEAGATERFGQVALRADETTQEFEADLETINETNAVLTGFLETCTDCEDVGTLVTGEGFSVFGLYADSLSALSAGEDGTALAEQHALSDVETRMSEDREQAAEYSQTLAMASASLILGYSTVLGLVVAVITWRLMLWKRDFTDSQYGDVILMGEMLNA